MIRFGVKDYIRYLEKSAEEIGQNKDYITGLDSATGDGDHWLNLNIGFEKLIAETGSWNELTYYELFQKIAMTMMSAMGGSSGVLYGSAYLRSANLLKDAEYIDDMLLGKILHSWAEAISERGGAEPGHKTMLDTIYPAAVAYQKAQNEGKKSEQCLAIMSDAARQGAEATKQMEAVKGRASYQTNKAVGFLDPGAVTMMMQLVCMSEYINENCQY